MLLKMLPKFEVLKIRPQNYSRLGTVDFGFKVRRSLNVNVDWHHTRMK